jgi:hypothetical protein
MEQRQAPQRNENAPRDRGGDRGRR